ncbi:hypothetical protein PHYSODRAFT_342794 [Phytophthora sojae]|uniref:Uncharacterized protein n=1 Tax=Phytophthora sojae (strain P6497) TaxID=1094619 RepID=G5AHM5_PHYSP|nr:hypothetical protein PHYSODRAFT_342794 [Phytophthora sojae]EGZ04946.1 hypothetical protein PHYSODRAFT_342794 [Phytophthora sojae]|eukprot:XP_009539576.1 hypothetical protein PHYSODRAFT_342794 [Phytophthora sojae]
MSTVAATSSNKCSADGNAVNSDGSALARTSGFSGVSGSEAPGSSSGRSDPQESCMTVQDGGDRHGKLDGRFWSPQGHALGRTVPRVPVDQYVDADGQIIEGEGGSLVSVGSFTGSISSVTSEGSTPSRRTVTRRVVASPARRTVVHKAGSSSGWKLYENGETTQSTPGCRIITRRVVTPQQPRGFEPWTVVSSSQSPEKIEGETNVAPTENHLEHPARDVAGSRWTTPPGRRLVQRERRFWDHVLYDDLSAASVAVSATTTATASPTVTTEMSKKDDKHKKEARHALPRQPRPPTRRGLTLRVLPRSGSARRDSGMAATEHEVGKPGEAQ